jgi:hypothetical protein
MTPKGQQAAKAQLLRIAQELRDPQKLRFATLGLLAAVLGLVYYQSTDTMGTLRTQLKKEQERGRLIEETQVLRTTEVALNNRFPPNGTVNFWTEYLLRGVRESKLNLLNLEPTRQENKQYGRFQGVQIRMEVEGSYRDVYRLVAWIEGGQWPVRVIRIQMKAGSKASVAEMTLAVLAEVKDS